MYARCFLLLPFLSAASAQSHIEHIVVSAATPPHIRALEDIAPLKRIEVRENSNLLDTASLLTQVPDVNLNGQGGLLQSVSLRGFSRWRVQTLIDGVPINTDRRAGTAAEFIDPAMLGGADILYGSASTYLGSNAIGGGVDLRLAAPQQPALRIAFRSNPSAADWLVGHTQGNTDIKLSHRHAGNGRAADGQPLFDEYRQTSALLRHRSSTHWLKEGWTLFSDGRDIGKSTSLFPDERITLYPQNRHWLGKFTFQPDTWHDTQASVYWHQSRLITETERVGNRNNVTDSEALDFGASVNRAYASENWMGNVSFLLDGRSGVRISEQEHRFGVDERLQQVTLDAKQMNLAVVADGQRQVGAGRLVTGARANWQRQQHHEQTWSEAQASGFIAYALPLSEHLSANVFAGSAFRTPTLTERFFNGETPRGEVIGDQDLNTEHAFNLQSQLTYEHDAHQFEINVFQQRIEHYIERLREGDTLRYQNLSRADVQGLSYQWRYQSAPWQTVLGGQWLQGEDDNGNPIADISPTRHDLTLHYQLDGLMLWAGAQLRQAHSSVGSGEIARPSHVTFSIGTQWQASDSMRVNVQLQNLGDRAFFTSQDEDAPMAQGRDLRIALAYLF